ncbi:bifunctional protein-serine/threonine kinase/phosphatase [Azospirillum sp. SYSU D00513]|uniref:bifunctional protein-serine/threonine kinase/phosphatase n=1 Tax=Azospirillum sp. SYSU D00513 TaxID=2812561 RepID=UPI001A959B2D|nr:bifunctional protein-serine/threonine kinase/phosphatase [Azospirillum sp. SYSU D00513]
MRIDDVNALSSSQLPSSQLRVQFGFLSETGKRPRNEDYLGVCLGTPGQRARQGIVAALADGVAGAKGGRVAAELTIRSFIEGYYAQPETLGVQRAAAAAIEAVNRWIVAQGRSDPEMENASCTFAALVLAGRKAHVLHVGDSRVYRLSEGRLTRLTEDHTLRNPNLSHVLYRAIGIEEAVRLDHLALTLRPHDRFLICSDGVHGALDDGAIRDLLLRRSAPEEAARELVEAALGAGSADNSSAIVLDVVGLPAIAQEELEVTMASLPIQDPPPSSGDRVDGLTLGPLLSEGRYSRLFRLAEPVDGRAAVIKFPQPAVAADATYRMAFIREAWVAARVHSPWVGELIEPPVERPSCLYSLMPYYEGETLEQRLRRKPRLPLQEGVEIAIKLSRAVSALHRAGIIHRDIKPDNVILQRDGGLKLIDLGVVRLPQVEDFPVADIPGTPSFMAPELFRGEGGDELTDLYALGVTVYRAFSGAYPYGEVEPFSRPRFTKAAPLSRHRPDLPAWLDLLLARATAADPKDRFGDVIEFALELENGLARGRPVIVRRVPLYDRDPVRFWQILCLLLLLALIAALLGD